MASKVGIILNEELIKKQIEEGKLEEALEYCNQPIFVNNIPVQLQKITILVKQEKFEQALRICNKDRFKDVILIQQKKTEILNLMYHKRQEKRKEKEEQLRLFLQVISKISIEEYDQIKNDIIKAKIKEWQKLILLVMLEEKINYPMQALINDLKTRLKIEQEKEMLKIIKMLLKHIKNKPQILDIAFYEKLLNPNKENRRLTF